MKHARMGGNPEAIENIKNEVEVMKAIRGHPHVLTLRAVVMQGPPGAEVTGSQPSDFRLTCSVPAKSDVMRTMAHCAEDTAQAIGW
jgi:hypothetical protein